MSEEAQADAEVREGQRIAKVMARAGLCSRREAEAWIAAGRVTVNGRALESPAYNVSAVDDVRVDGRPLAAPERTRLFLFHKPRGLVTTARDPEGRPTIFDALPPALPRVVAVGRLDINTEGLLLLTNDGGLARVLELPATGWLRRYRVRAHGRVDQAQLAALSDGLTLEGVHYVGIEARLDREQGANVWITMGLREGKNREIKKVLEHLGLTVNRLIRVGFGPFELGDLAEGEVAEVRTRVLRDQLGARLAKEAGADFDAPLTERAPGATETGEPGRRPHAGRAHAGASERKRERKESRQPRLAQDALPRRGPPASSTPPRRRKHVSALRAEIAADAAGPRKRVERSATHDRRGRTIAVERLTPAGEAAHSRFDSERGGTRRGAARAAGRSRKARETVQSNRASGDEGGERPRAAGRRARPEFTPRGAPPKRRDGNGPRRGFDRAEESRPGTRSRSGPERFDPRKRAGPDRAPREGGPGARRDVDRSKDRDFAPKRPPKGPGGRGPGRGKGGSDRRPPKKR